MTRTTKPAWCFEDAGDHVQIDLPGLSAGVKADFTGDSVQVRSTHGSGEILFEVSQLYSTIDAEGSRLEVWGFQHSDYHSVQVMEMGPCSSIASIPSHHSTVHMHMLRYLPPCGAVAPVATEIMHASLCRKQATVCGCI